MPTSISSQSEYYGLPTPARDEAPSTEKVADLLRPAPLWEGPMRLEEKQ